MRWYASGTRPIPDHPSPGDVVAIDHAAWRVIEIGPCPEEEWSERDREQVQRYGQDAAPVAVILRPARVTSNDVRARDHDKHFIVGVFYEWQVYPDEHYPVCASCLEPLPCREKNAERTASREIRWMERFETPGMCPACGEVVTRRQETRTFPDNLEVPLGPPVTFHLRKKCRGPAAQYEKQWVAADPKHRVCTFSCRGTLINHSDSTYECTESMACPGPKAEHAVYTMCRCPECLARTNGRWWGCHPTPNAVRRNGSDTLM